MSLKEPSQDLSDSPSPEEAARKRPVSERKIQANRRNALRSTGPTTGRGKRNVSRNAIKHGILAREVVILAGDGEESLKEFLDLAERLWEDYEPVGVVEEQLVQTIVTCWWRKARVIRAENGEIRKRLDAAALNLTQRNSDKVNLALAQIGELTISSIYKPPQTVWPRDEWLAIQSLQINLRESHISFGYLQGLLTLAKSEIASSGYISEVIRREIFSSFCTWDYELAHTCLYHGWSVGKIEDKTAKEIEDRKASQEVAQLLEIIDVHSKWLSELERYKIKRENLAVDAEARSFSLPPADVTDKLQRYETHLDKQLYRAMDQLERLQRQRRGEKVPPPLTINVGRGR